MKAFTYTIKEEMGIHARPAGLMAKQAKKFDAVSTITCGDRSADLKKLFAIMAMTVKQGEEVQIQAEGPEEDAAIEFLEGFFAKHF
jgi:phosphocarrier protein